MCLYLSTLENIIEGKQIPIFQLLQSRKLRWPNTIPSLFSLNHVNPVPTTIQQSNENSTSNMALSCKPDRSSRTAARMRCKCFSRIDFNYWPLHQLISLPEQHLSNQAFEQLQASCLVAAASELNCALTNTTCLCSNEFSAVVTPCVETNCTVREALTATNITAATCGLPSASRQRILKILPPASAAIATVVVFAKVAERCIAKTPLKPEDYLVIVSWVSYPFCKGWRNSQNLKWLTSRCYWLPVQLLPLRVSIWLIDMPMKDVH
jgi:hypothetical protein